MCQIPPHGNEDTTPPRETSYREGSTRAQVVESGFLDVVWTIHRVVVLKRERVPYGDQAASKWIIVGHDAAGGPESCNSRKVRNEQVLHTHIRVENNV